MPVPLSLALTLLGRLADAATTYLALMNPLAYEQNPFMRPLLGAPILFLLVQLLGGAAMWLAAYAPTRLLRSRALKLALLAYPVALSWLPAFSNISVALGGDALLPPLYSLFE